MEGVELYTESAKVADEEGFAEIASHFRAIAEFKQLEEHLGVPQLVLCRFVEHHAYGEVFFLVAPSQKSRPATANASSTISSR
mgnify:CR=1 FL=1